MTTQVAWAEERRREDVLAFRVRQLREHEAELSARLAPRGAFDRMLWSAEAAAASAAREVERVLREREAAVAALEALRSQIADLSGSVR